MNPDLYVFYGQFDKQKIQVKICVIFHCHWKYNLRYAVESHKKNGTNMF